MPAAVSRFPRYRGITLGAVLFQLSRKPQLGTRGDEAISVDAVLVIYNATLCELQCKITTIF